MTKNAQDCVNISTVTKQFYTHPAAVSSLRLWFSLRWDGCECFISGKSVLSPNVETVFSHRSLVMQVVVFTLSYILSYKESIQ